MHLWNWLWLRLRRRYARMRPRPFLLLLERWWHRCSSLLLHEDLVLSLLNLLRVRLRLLLLRRWRTIIRVLWTRPLLRDTLRRTLHLRRALHLRRLHMRGETMRMRGYILSIVRVVDSWVWHVSISVWWLMLLLRDERALPPREVLVPGGRPRSRMRLWGMLALLWMVWKYPIWNWW